jgi:peptidoglycan/LPS O-acetylase OafA/YrhL
MLVQHFWAVSLIGQTYLVWPFVIRLGRLAGSRAVEDRRKMLLLVSVLSFGSFCWSLYATHSFPARAYFDFFSRFWEFGCGVVLGLRSFRDERLTPGHAAVMSWLGLALLAGCGFVVGATLSFPGYASLWPVTAALLLIRYGQPENRLNASWWLSRPWFAGLGAISFGIYLWHWPLYVAYASGANHVGTLPPLPGLGLLALSIACAVLGKMAVDWCFSSRRVSSSTTVVPLAFLSLLLMISLSSECVRRAIHAKGVRWDADSKRTAGFIAPGPFSIRADNASVYKSGCHQNGTSENLKTCSFGKPGAKKKLSWWAVLTPRTGCLRWFCMPGKRAGKSYR